MVKTIARDDVLAVMPHPVLTKISGEPTYQNMKRWKKEQFANLIAVEMPNDWGRGKGMLGELQDPPVFLARNGAAYNPPNIAPDNYPIIPNGSTTAERERLRADNDLAQTYWKTAEHARRITVNIGAAAFEKFVYAELDDVDEGLNGVDLRSLYDHVMDRFASISQHEIDANLAEFNEGIDPSLTLAVYTRKQEKCQEIAADAEVPITEATMVTTGTKHAVATGGLEQEWKTWHTTAQPKTWLNWKTFWTAAFKGKRELIKLTGSAFNNMANSAHEAELGDKMVDSLDRLANAAVQKTNDIERLVQSISTLTATVNSQATDITRLHDIIAVLAAGGTKPADKTTSGTTANWDPTGYCWWHGYKVKCGHNSTTCDKGKKDTANYNQHKDAKRGDEQGGCEWNKIWKAK